MNEYVYMCFVHVIEYEHVNEHVLYVFKTHAYVSL